MSRTPGRHAGLDTGNSSEAMTREILRTLKSCINGRFKKNSVVRLRETNEKTGSRSLTCCSPARQTSNTSFSATIFTSPQSCPAHQPSPVTGTAESGYTAPPARTGFARRDQHYSRLEQTVLFPLATWPWSGIIWNRRD